MTSIGHFQLKRLRAVELQNNDATVQCKTSPAADRVVGAYIGHGKILPKGLGVALSFRCRPFFMSIEFRQAMSLAPLVINVISSSTRYQIENLICKTLNNNYIFLELTGDIYIKVISFNPERLTIII